MDPNECLRRWREAFAAGNQVEEAKQARADLAGWLNSGGFWPSKMTEEECYIMWLYFSVPRPPRGYSYGR